jgi:transposase-like protein
LPFGSTESELTLGKIKRKFDIEFKKQLVALVDSGQATLSQVAAEHQISAGLIVKWRRQIREGSLVAGPTSREKALEAELTRYRELCGKQAFEIDLLKKIHEDLRRSREERQSVVTSSTLDPSKKGAK